MVELRLRDILYIPIFGYLFGFGSYWSDEHFLEGLSTPFTPC